MTDLMLQKWAENNTPFNGNVELWQAFSKAVSDLQKLVWEDPRIKDELTKAEGLRYLTRLVAGAIPMTMESWNPDYPSLLTFLSSRIQYGLPAADALYQWATVHGDHVYRIKGERGSAYMLDVESRKGHFAHVDRWQVVDRSSAFEVNDDGSFEIVLSREKQPGNWLEIGEGLGDIIFRQYFYDWEHEQPARVQITRDNAHYPAPPLTPDVIAKRMQLLIDWISTLPAFFATQVESYYAVPTNDMTFDEVSIGWAELRYGKCNYECAEDEALVIELTPPQAQYWSLQLYSQYWDARDWNLRQTSINGHQALIDPDGKFRAVISHRDPGVQNWLDAASHTTGLLSARYFRADAFIVPKITRVKLADVHQYISNPAQAINENSRSEQLRKRAESVTRRGCL